MHVTVNDTIRETITNIVSIANTNRECKKLSQIIDCQMKSRGGRHSEINICMPQGG